MKRHRKIAAAPERTATECWATIAELIADSVNRSKHVSDIEVADSLEAASGIGRLLVGGGHLDKNALTVVAADLHLSLTTVSGDAALSLEENLNPVAGAANAGDWTIYLPAPAPLTTAVETVAAENVHLSSEDPPSATAKARETSQVGLLNQDALAAWARSRQ